MTSRTLPEPVVCVRLRRGLDADNVVGDLLPRMGGVTLPSVQRQILRDAWKARTSTVFPMYLFSLHAREQHAVRLEMYGESLESLVEWLTRMDHPGARRLDERIVILQIADRFHISCDVGPEGWLDRVGIEASFRHWPHREPGWRRLFTGLVKHDLCTPSKEKAVWEWSGHEADSRGFNVRALSHVKISAKPDSASQAKVYFLLQRLERTKS